MLDFQRPSSQRYFEPVPRDSHIQRDFGIPERAWCLAICDGPGRRPVLPFGLDRATLGCSAVRSHLSSAYSVHFFNHVVVLSPPRPVWRRMCSAITTCGGECVPAAGGKCESLMIFSSVSCVDVFLKHCWPAQSTSKPLAVRRCPTNHVHDAGDTRYIAFLHHKISMLINTL